MNADVQERVSQWMEETFRQIGEFCEATLEVVPDSLTYKQLTWPAEDIKRGTRVGAVQQVRGGEPPEPFGFVFDRGFAIYLACRLLMLLPGAIEEKMRASDGPIEEDDLEGISELGNVVTGVVNQLAQGAIKGAWQIEFSGLHAPDRTPKNAAFPPKHHAFEVKVRAEKRTFKTQLFLSQAVLENWFADLLEPPKAAEAEVAAPVEAPRALVAGPSQQPWIIVDAVESDAAHLAGLLAGEGLAACIASTIPATIELLKEHIVEGLFVDVTLEDEPGIHLLKKLRHNFLTEDLPIIITSGSVTREQVMEAVRTGATHVLVKPATEATLKSTVAKALARHPRLRLSRQRREEASARTVGEAAPAHGSDDGAADAPQASAA